MIYLNLVKDAEIETEFCKKSPEYNVICAGMLVLLYY